MFRAYCYLSVVVSGMESVRLTSQAVGSPRTADELLAHFGTLPGYTGGGLEQRADGIGWVLYTE